MYLKEIGWGRGVNWIDLAQDRKQWRPVVKTVLNFRSPLKTSNFLTSRGTVTFSRRILFQTDSYSQGGRVRFAAAAVV
jgi:hypothetical protein